MYRCMRCLIWTHPASWAALVHVAQLVRASIRSAECRGFKPHLRQMKKSEATHFSSFHLPQVPVFLSFFLFISSHHVHIHVSIDQSYGNTIYNVHVHVHVHDSIDLRVQKLQNIDPTKLTCKLPAHL